MGLFGNSELENKVEQLEKRVNELESQNKIVYYSSSYWMNWLYHKKAMPSISLKKAIEMIFDHLKIELNHEEEQPEKFELRKVKRPRN